MLLRVILRNVLSNWAGYFVATVAGFLLSPLIVSQLGNAGYGVWTLIVSLTGYMGLLDLGVRSSVGRFVARHVSLKDSAGVNRTVTTAIVMLAASGALAFLAALWLSYRLDWFHLDPAFRAEAPWALRIAGLNIALALPAGAFGAILIALERNDVIGAVSVAGSLTRSGLVLLALRANYGIGALALAALTASVAESVAWAVLAKRLYAPLRIFGQPLTGDAFRELFTFSAYRFLWIIASQAIYSDALVISVYINAAAVTTFAIAATLVTYARTLVSLATDPLSPSATRLDAMRDMEGLRNLLIFGTRLSLLIAVPVTIGFLYFGRQFIALWMGAGQTASAAVLFVLAVPLCAGLSQYTSALILVSMARHRVLAFVTIAEAAANLLLSIALIQRMGVIGAAWGTAIPQVLAAATLAGYTLLALEMSPWHYLRQAYLRPLICAVPVALLAHALSSSFPITSWPRFVACAGLVAVSYLALSYCLCLSAEQREVLLARLPRFLRRSPALRREARATAQAEG